MRKLTALGKCLGLASPARVKEIFCWYKLWRSWPVWEWVQGAEYFRAARYREAAERYLAGLNHSSYHPAAHSARFDYAYCLYRLGDLETALSELTFLVMVRSSVRDAYLLYSRIQLSFGRPSSAITVLRRALEIMPEDVLLLSLLMQAKLRAGASAIELNSCKRRLLACKRKIHLDDARQYVVDTALAYYEIFVGDVETGERYLARVLASGKAPCDAILLRGERLIAQGRLLQAREQLTRAMLYAPRNPRAALILARSYLMDSKDRNPEWAFSLAETSCKLSGWMNAEALLVLVDSLRLLGEHDKAELFLLRAKKLPSYRELQRGHVALDWAVLDEEKLSNS